MTTDDFSPIYVGDTAARLAPVFIHKDGNAVDLTGATIIMKMEDSGVNAKTALGTWVIDNATGGLAHYNYANADVNVAGIWTLFITITISGKPVHADEKVLEIRNAP